MRKKKKVSVYLDAEKVRIAKDLGLNLSKLFENTLDRAISALSSLKAEMETNGGYVDARSASHQPRSGPGGTFDPSKDFRTRVLLSASQAFIPG